MSAEPAARVIVRSLHRGGAGVIRALAPHFRLPPQELAARIFRSPAELATMPAGLAESLAGALRDAGLDVTVEPPGPPLPQQVGHDVAIYVRDPGRLAEIAAELALVLGSAPAEAAAALCATPATVLGGVSAASGAAIAARLAPLGAEVDLSVPAEAHYDLFATGTNPADLATVRAVLAPLGVSVGAPPVLAAGLDHATAERAWRDLGPRGLVRVLDQAFQRFDVTLKTAPAEEDFHPILAAAVGMPAAVVPKVLARLPVVVASGVRRADLERVVAPLLSAGAVLDTQLVTFRSFVPTITAVGDAAAAAELVSAIAGIPDAAARLRRLPLALPPLGDLRARWLQAELKRRGARVVLEAS